MTQKGKQEKRKKIWVERFEYEVIGPLNSDAHIKPDERLPSPFANRPTPSQIEGNKGKKGARHAR